MNALLQTNELLQWQRARSRMLQMIEIVQQQIRAEMRKRQPSIERIGSLDAQYAFLVDARYDLSVHDERAVAAALAGRVIFRDRELCFHAPVTAMHNRMAEDTKGRCSGICSTKQRQQCAILRYRSSPPSM